MKPLLLLLTAMFLSGCAAHTHNVGETKLFRPAVEKVSETQFYLIDLKPLNNVDTAQMAKGCPNYVIETKRSFTDYLISVGTFGIVTARTVTIIINCLPE